MSKGGIGLHEFEALQLCWQAMRIWKVFPGEAKIAKLLCQYDLDARSFDAFSAREILSQRELRMLEMTWW